MQKRVVIVQEFLPQYRVPFFRDLREELAARSIELTLVHGQPPAEMASRRDASQLPWARRITNRQTALGSTRFVWQPALRVCRNADLVVVEQANRLLFNYALLALRRFPGAPRVAFWGHGANLQADDRYSMRERFKRRMAILPDWWFAYTRGVAARLRALGYPDEKISIVQNSIDVSAHGIASERTKTKDLCVFVGGLASTKRLDFLVEAAELIHRQLPTFRLTVIGDGPERDCITRAAARLPWLTYAGPAFGSAKANLMSEAQLMLMPGLVGLAVIDAFAAGTPIVTTDIPTHSPEIEYVRSGSGGVILPGATTPELYAAQVVRLLSNPIQLSAMQDASRAAANQFSLSAMVGNFASGLEAALSSERRRL